MKKLALFGIMAAPFVIGAIAANNTEGGANMCAALFFSLLMQRESTKICLILMRHWRMFEQAPQTFSFFAPFWDARELQPMRVYKSKRSQVHNFEDYHRR